MTLIKPIEPPCAKRNKRADHGLDEEDQLQNGLNMNMKARQSLEGTKDRRPTTCKQNSNIKRSMPVTEQAESQSAGQLTLRAMERPTWCTNEQGNPRVFIFGLEIRGQDAEVTRRVLTQATKTAARSSVCLLVDKG